MIDQSTKEQIKNELAKYVTHSGSANKAATKLDISNGTVSNILNDKEEKISDDMWRKVATLLGFKIDEKWQHVDTVPFKKLTANLYDARIHANTFGIVCHPGSGKTHALNKFVANHQNIISVKCVDLMKVRSFYIEILKSLGRKADSYNLYDIQQQIVRVISTLEAPVIIIDELERVKDSSVLSQFIDLYNMLEDNCGLVVLGTSVLKGMSERGNNRNKVNWNTFFDRIGAKWIELTPPSENDVLAILKANGIVDLNDAYFIANDCVNDNSQYSLRRVKRKVHAYKQKQAAQAEMEVTA